MKEKLYKKDAKEKIKKHLPTGYQKIIQERLKYRFSVSYIGQVLDPDNERWNESIIDEGVRLALENKANTEKISKSIDAL